MKEKLMKATQSFSKAMVQPIMFLSVIGLLTILGVLTTNPNVVNKLTFLQADFIRIPGTMIYEAMMFVINNLSIIFCVGIAAAIGKEEKAESSLVALMTYLAYLVSSNQFLKLTGRLVPPEQLMGSGQTMTLGLQVVDTGVFAGIILGIMIGLIHKKAVHKNFKGALALYSGSRLTLILSVLCTVALSIVLCLTWPIVQQGIGKLTVFIANSGTVGLFSFGFLDRILIPTGLHHLVYTPIFFSELGGVVEVGGQAIAGVIPIAMMEMRNPEVLQFSESVLYTTSGLAKVFGLPGAALAMYHCAKPANKAKVKGILLPAVFTAVLVGITEPLEFAFLFCAPLLFVLHAVLTGASMVILSLLGVTSNGSGGLINFIVTNVIAGVEKTGWPAYVAVGALMFGIYYFTFKFLIKKFNLKTPGREKEETEKSDVKLLDLGTKAMTVINGLGGKENIESVENCFTRLRVNVKDISKLDEALINKVDNSGIVKKGNNVQIIYGLQVQTMRKAVDKTLQSI